MFDSPRSIQACKQLGVEFHELYYIDLHEFKENNPDIRLMEPNIQHMRFEHMENIRLQTIKEVIEVIIIDIIYHIFIC